MARVFLISRNVNGRMRRPMTSERLAAMVIAYLFIHICFLLAIMVPLLKEASRLLFNTINWVLRVRRIVKDFHRRTCNKCFAIKTTICRCCACLKRLALWIARGFTYLFRLLRPIGGSDEKQPISNKKTQPISEADDKKENSNREADDEEQSISENDEETLISETDKDESTNGEEEKEPIKKKHQQNEQPISKTDDKKEPIETKPISETADEESSEEEDEADENDTKVGPINKQQSEQSKSAGRWSIFYGSRP